MSKRPTKNLAVRVVDWETEPLSLTAEEAAAIIRVGVSAIYETVRAGGLRGTWYGPRKLRISRYELQRFHEGREVQPLLVPVTRQAEDYSGDARAAA